ncbi:unnamed protein product [Prorocentrum cordatum]|uniref:Peptidase C1A papain C-terminal domain-containing protein n=1 Tax=Prorocentrum cordatum TaxID=2364126 RepID=A0ABN9QGE0_9DINO|nr:unnamed protein product [Polarella glacialis]
MPMNGDNWESIGKYYGRKDGQNYLDAGGATYACHCDVTSTGWWSRRAESGGQEAGCLWATKSGLVQPGASLVDWLPTRSSASSLVRLRRAAAPEPGSAAAAAAAAGVGSFALGGSGAGGPVGLGAGSGAAFKEVLRLKGGGDRQAPAATSGGDARRVVSLRGVSAHPAAATGRGNESEQALGIVQHSSRLRGLDRLPTNFDWREELAGMVPPGQDPLAQQSDQGPCGSCYAFAGIMVLQMRFRVQLYKQHGILYPLELSYKSPTRCSPYTEGCNGGFSYFIFRLASEVGVPLADCDQQVPAGALQQTCDWKCYKGNEELFYAKDYWHVGGFSHGSSEERIMREIYENGPVELAFSTTAVPEFVKLSGQSAKDDTDVMTVILNDHAPKERYSSNPSVHRWWFATHAILAVGWGEETVKWGMVKYWTVRNSWGRDWGEGGYAKLRRGNNDGGAENDASMVVPDLSRLPAGFLEKARKYHADQEANRRSWKASAEAAPVAGHNRGGVPDYCKTRPDSIDCK